MSLASEEGQSTVEAAFALPVLMLLVLLLLQPGIVLYDKIVMNEACSEGCRLLATMESANAKEGEDFIKRRLSAVPQVDVFHVHSSSCSWDVRLIGDESSQSVTVSISHEVKPLPLLDIGFDLVGATNERGNLVITSEATSKVRADWTWSSVSGSSPSDWVRE